MQAEKKQMYVLTEEEVVQILKTQPLSTWLCWLDTNFRENLSFVFADQYHRQPAKSSLNQPLGIVVHVGTSQGDKWHKIMSLNVEVDDHSIFAILTPERLRAQLNLPTLSTDNQQSANNGGNAERKYLAMLDFISILKNRNISDVEITKLISLRGKETYEPNLKEKVFTMINAIQNLNTKIELLNTILNNQLNPYTHLLRYDEWWKGFWGGLSDTSRPSKIRIIQLLNEANQNSASLAALSAPAPNARQACAPAYVEIAYDATFHLLETFPDFIPTTVVTQITNLKQNLQILRETVTEQKKGAPKPRRPNNNNNNNALANDLKNESFNTETIAFNMINTIESELNALSKELKELKDWNRSAQQKTSQQIFDLNKQYSQAHEIANQSNQLDVLDSKADDLLESFDHLLGKK